MKDMHSYLAWAKDIPFEELPFNEVDNVLVSQIVYLPMERALSAGESASVLDVALALEGFEAEKLQEIFLRQQLDTLRRMAAAPRFMHLVISHFVDEYDPQTQKQFCALTLTLPDGIKVIAFRGTDTTLTGWREDFNMSYATPVPAQRAAVAYLRQVAGGSIAPLIVLGHSKGGNLAVYAAAYAPSRVQERIHTIYTNDGPGLMTHDVQSAGYQRVSERIVSLLPQSTMVGILLHQHEPYRVVRSHGIGLFQHDAYSWEVEDNAPRFVSLPALSRASRFMEKTVENWLEGLSPGERQVFCDAIFDVLTAGNDETIIDLVRTDRQRAAKILGAARGIPPEVRSALAKALGGLVGGTLESIGRELKEAVKSILPADKPGALAPGETGQQTQK